MNIIILMIFFSLPSLPGLQSECEEELLLLMREVDSEFQRKYNELLKELKNVRSLCRAQRDEIENLRSFLMPSSEVRYFNKLLTILKIYRSTISMLSDIIYSIIIILFIIKCNINLISKSQSSRNSNTVTHFSYYKILIYYFLICNHA